MFAPIRSPRCFLFTWLTFALFVAAVPLTCQIGQRRRLARVPQNLTQLAERIQAKHPTWHIVRAANTGDGLESGFWLTLGEQSVEHLSGLLRQEEYGSTWDGIVLCRQADASYVRESRSPHLAIIGRLGLFGDPQMIDSIIKSLEE